METKRFRNHFSIIFERIGSFILVLLFFIVTQFTDIITEITTSGFSLIPILLGIGGILLFIGVIFGWQYFVWSKTWIVLDEDTISIEQNTLNASKHTIGIKNISNVNTEQNLLEMFLGTCKVKLDTDSLSTANTTDVMIVLKKQEAEELRKRLVKRMNEINETTEVEEVVAFDDDNIDYDDKAELKDIIMNGFYSVNLLTVLIFLGSIGAFVDVMLDFVTGAVSGFEVEGALSAIFAIGIFLVSSLSGLAKSFLGMYGFMVKRDGSKLYIKYGLFKKVNFAIPVDKINAIQIQQTMIARIFKKYTAEMINVGMGDEENSSAYFTFYGSREKLQKSIDLLLPEFSEAVAAKFEKQPKSVMALDTIGIVVSAVVLSAIGACIVYFTEVPIVVIVAGGMALLCLRITSKVLTYFSTGTSVTESYLGLQYGCFGTCRTIIKFNKVQYVTLYQNVLDRKLRIAHGKANILAMMGKETQNIPYISEDKVELINKYIKR